MQPRSGDPDPQHARPDRSTRPWVPLAGEGLTIGAPAELARGRAEARITTAPGVRERVESAHACMQAAVARGETVYGVTTGFGGMADVLCRGRLDRRPRRGLAGRPDRAAGRRRAVTAWTSSSLLGSWRLLGLREPRPGRPSARPFGTRPAGTLVYLPTGGMVVAPACDEALPAEVAADAPFGGFLAYLGRFVADPGAGTVRHTVEGCSFAPWRGREVTRHGAFDAGTLVLTSAPTTIDGRTVVSELRWERTAAPPPRPGVDPSRA